MNALKIILATTIGIGLGLIATSIAGESPLHVLSVLVNGAFGSPYNFGMTLVYATPLIFTGLAVALPFHAGLFNIGAEGQLLMGALFAAAVGITFSTIPAPYSWIIGGCAAAIGGGLVGAISGWLRAYRGSHEVITTIMLNFIVAAFTSWCTLYLWKSQETQNPETHTIGESFQFSTIDFFNGAQVNATIIVAFVSAILLWRVLRGHVFGFRIRAVGMNEAAAALSGINVKRTQFWSMTLAGALAGCVGINEIMGGAFRFRIGFSPDFGFMGIPVALLARCHPLGVVVSAFLFGALHKGTSDLDLETTFVTKDLSQIFQALVIFTISAERLWSSEFWKPLFKRKAP